MQMINNTPGTDVIDIANASEAKRVGRRIRKIRMARGLTQPELGERTNLTADRIQKYENGAGKPKTDLLKRIADALDVSVLALDNPSTASYINIMYFLFDLENNHGFELEKNDQKMCLSIDFRKDFYKYLEGWYEEYTCIHTELEAATSEEERKEILDRYYNWEWNYPTGISEKAVRDIHKKRIRDKIAELQDELCRLESADEG